MKLFTIFDQKTKAFEIPFCAPNSDVAIRIIRGMASQEGHVFNKFPKDFSLWEVGDFDVQKGELLGKPKMLVIEVYALEPEVTLAVVDKGETRETA